jgi:hypothetical protein
MPARRLKHKFRSMDIPCRSSWTGSHANFKAREYDAGASLMTSKTNVEAEDSWKTSNTSFPILNFP